jgi:hypothetical protein
MPKNQNVTPYLDGVSSHKTGSLDPSITEKKITETLGVEPDKFNDEKVTVEWSFAWKGQPCAIWDYRGAQWSTYGPPEAFRELFGRQWEAYPLGRTDFT